MSLRERQARVRDLMADLPAVTQRMVAAVREEVPAYRALDAAQQGEVRDIAAWALSRVLWAWSEDGRLTEEDVTRFRAIGAARAEDGRSITAVLRAYRVAAVAATDFLLDTSSDRLEVSDAKALMKVVLTTTDQMSEAILAGHVAARDRLSSHRHLALADLFVDLLAGRHSSMGAVTERSRELEIELPARPVLLVAEPADRRLAAQHSEIRGLTEDLGLLDPPVEHLAVLRGRRAVLLLPDRVLPAIAGVLEARRWRGCAIGEDTVLRVAAGYRLAAQAVDIAPDHAFQRTPLLGTGDVQVLALLAAAPGAAPETLAKAVLGPVTEPANLHVLDGLTAYLAAGSATEAAERLHVHPQTLRYRLRRAAELIGRDPGAGSGWGLSLDDKSGEQPPRSSSPQRDNPGDDA